jgi:hypothetical protein
VMLVAGVMAVLVKGPAVLRPRARRCAHDHPSATRAVRGTAAEAALVVRTAICAESAAATRALAAASARAAAARPLRRRRCRQRSLCARRSKRCRRCGASKPGAAACQVTCQCPAIHASAEHAGWD